MNYGMIQYASGPSINPSIDRQSSGNATTDLAQSQVRNVLQSSQPRILDNAAAVSATDNDSNNGTG